MVENGELRAIFKHPRHPYTQGLLEAIPRLSDDRERLFQITGTVPAAGAIWKGCPFHPPTALFGPHPKLESQHPNPPQPFSNGLSDKSQEIRLHRVRARDSQ